MEYEHINCKFHFWDRVIYEDESYIVVSYNDNEWLYEVYRDWEHKYSDDKKYRFWHWKKLSERVLKRDYKWEMKDELEIVDMSRDIVKAHKELINKINTNKKWYNWIFN